MVLEKLKIRFAEKNDGKYITLWLTDSDILRWFPMCNAIEIEDSVKIWMSYADQKAVLTAVYDNVICGSALLYINSFKKISHHALFAIIVDKNYRNKGIGKALLHEMMSLAKERFKLKFLHLEVYNGNPAKRLYEREGFKEYGTHKRFLKDANGIYYDKILMQKEL
jgi:ribosomal protein S18 acetylase RimI-like enzyme